MPAASRRRWTATEVRALPEEPGKRFEVVDGELLVTPAPSYAHQRAVGILFALLREYLRTHRVGDVMLAPADVDLDEHTLVQPDLFVVPLVNGRPPNSYDEVRRLLLAVEVLSPTTRRQDRVVKRPRYQRAGTECWIIDLDARVVERWRPDDQRPEILHERLDWNPGVADVPFELDLDAFFTEALGAP